MRDGGSYEERFSKVGGVEQPDGRGRVPLRQVERVQRGLICRRDFRQGAAPPPPRLTVPKAWTGIDGDMMTPHRTSKLALDLSPGGAADCWCCSCSSSCRWRWSSWSASSATRCWSASCRTSRSRTTSTCSTNPTTWRLYFSTIKFTLIVLAITFVLGFWIAYFLVFHVRNLLTAIGLFLVCTVPFWTSNIIRMISWRPVLGKEGLINQRSSSCRHHRPAARLAALSPISRSWSPMSTCSRCS